MKILIVHRYFYPDSPTYAFLLYKLAKNFKTYFDDVTVLTSMPSYYGSSTLKATPREECLDGINVKRLKLLPEHNRSFLWRLINSSLFAFSVFFHLLFRGSRYHVVQVATTPPIMSALAVALTSKIRGIRFVYHCQDIYPDITTAGKEDGSKSLAFKLMCALDKFIMRCAWKIVVLSGDMKQHLVQTRQMQSTKIEIINNFDFNRRNNSTGLGSEMPTSLMPIINTNRRKIIFAGNLGLFQNLDLVFKTIDQVVTTNNVTFIVVGDGVKKEELEKRYKSEQIVFTGFLSNEILQAIYSYCHLGLVPVVAGIEKVAYPSKIISYTLSGLPVLTFSSEESLIAQFITENELGGNYGFEGEMALRTKMLELVFKDFDRDKIKNKASIEFGEQTAYYKWKTIYQGVEAS